MTTPAPQWRVNDRVQVVTDPIGIGLVGLFGTVMTVESIDWVSVTLDPVGLPPGVIGPVMFPSTYLQVASRTPQSTS